MTKGKRYPKLTWLLQTLAHQLGTTDQALTNRRQDLDTIENRHLAIYEACTQTDYTYTDIGKAFGGRSPATITHAFQKIARRKEVANANIRA